MKRKCVFTKEDGRPYLKFRYEKVIDENGIIFSDVLEIIENFNEKGYAIIKFKNGVHAFINDHGDKILECDAIKDLNDEGIGGFIIAKYSEKYDLYFYGYIDENLNIRINPEYTCVRHLGDYYFYKTFGGGEGLKFILYEDGTLMRMN